MIATLRACLAAIALAALATSAAAETVNGSGVASQQTRAVAGTRAVSLAVPGHLEIVQGDAESLALSGDDNVLPLVESVLENGRLRIRFRDQRSLRVHPKLPLKLTLTAKSLDAIAVAGSGDVRAPSLNVPKLNVSIAGSGDVNLTGRAETLEVSINGAGDVKAGRFEAERVNVSIAGSGEALVWASRALQASIAGSGDVRYIGEATVQQSIAGSGRVRRVTGPPG